jgi:DNA-damage-inducible protein J
MTTKTATLNARLEPQLKAKAERVLRKLDLSPTEAVRLFYRQIALRQGLPFDVCIPNAKTVSALEEAEAGGGKVYRGSGRQIVDSILHE